ncbi:MAG: DUF3325 domain-containing protein [Bacteroidota bacterium]
MPDTLLTDGLLLAAGIAVAYVGFALLALSLDRNWKKVTKAVPPASWTPSRAAGYVLLGLAVVPLFLRDEVVSFAIVSWVLWLGVAALAVAFTLTWQPGWLGALAGALASGPPEASPPAKRPPGAPRPGKPPPGKPPTGKRPPTASTPGPR